MQDTRSQEPAVTLLHEFRLSYLFLARRLVRANKADALLRLGISTEQAEALASLSVPQAARMASSEEWRFDCRMDQALVASFLKTEDRFDDQMHALHVELLMVNRLSRETAREAADAHTCVNAATR